jgi:nodulation protein E
VPNEARRQPLRNALSNSFAFGGLNAVLAFRRFN